MEYFGGCHLAGESPSGRAFVKYFDHGDGEYIFFSVLFGVSEYQNEMFVIDEFLFFDSPVEQFEL